MQNRIKEHRERLGMTQEQLADAMETSTQQVSRLERSEHRLSDVWLKKLSTALGVSKADILIDAFVAPGFSPREGDFAKDDIERRLLKFWRILSPEAHDIVLTLVDAWASRIIGRGKD